MEKLINKYLFVTVLAIALTLFTLQGKAVLAQSPTPSPSNSQNLVTPTPSITTTSTPEVTQTPTPSATPVPTPKIDVISTVATVGTQYPWNKKIPVKLSITPTLSGSKLEVRWQKKAGLVASPLIRTIQDPRAGTTYTVSFILTPYAYGFQRAVADIILTTNTTNYVSSKDIPLQLNTEKVIVPATPMYTIYTVLMYLFIFLLFFVAIPFALYKLYLYIKKYVFPRWLEAKIQNPK